MGKGPKAIVCVFALAACVPTQAAPLIFQYSGVVRSITLLDGETDTLGLSVGSAVNGSFFFDPDSLDTDPSGTRAFYENPLLRMRFDGVQSTPRQYDYSSFVVNADPAHDQVSAYLATEYENLFEVFTFSLESPGPSAVLGSDRPDWQALSLADFDLSDSRFEFIRTTFIGPLDGPVPRTLISAGFTSLRIRPVAEPDTLVLLGLGLAGLGLSRRRRAG